MAPRSNHVKSATAARPAKKTTRKKLTERQAVDKMYAIIKEHLQQFPEEERNRRIDSFIKHVDEITAAPAKPSASPRASGPKR